MVNFSLIIRTSFIKVLLLLFFIIFPVSKSFADSTFIFRDNEKPTEYKWNCNPANDSTLTLSKKGAIHGGKGILIQRVGDHNVVKCSQRLDFKREFWQRMYFRLDSCWSKVGNIEDKDTSLFEFFYYNFSELSGTNQPHYFMQFFLVKYPKDSSLYLLSRINLSANRKNNICFKYKIDKKKIYCFENHLSFFNEESLKVDIIIDGNTLFSQSFDFNYSHDFLSVCLTNGSKWFTSANWLLHVDDFMLSKNRISAIPPKPINCTFKLDNYHVELKCEKFSSQITNEKQNGVRWRLFSQTLPDTPIFDLIEIDPAFYNSYKIPFPLDSGRYLWQVKFRNIFNNWGEWSKPSGFTVEKMRPLSLTIKRVEISSLKNGANISSIVPGEWYNLNINLKATSKWTRFFYVVSVFSHSSYPFATPIDRGGKFLPDANYVSNFSVIFKDGLTQKSMFYKTKENSISSTELPFNTKGSYIDNSKGVVELDTLNGNIKLRVRLLEKAKSGKWQLMVYAENADENISNIYRASFNVISLDKSRSKKMVLIPLLIVILFVFSLSLFFFKRKRPETVNIKERDIIFENMVEYISRNLNVEITVKKIREELRLGKEEFYRTMKKHEVGALPKLVNKLRIKRAKELILSTNRTITEIGFDVGFNDSSYFSKIFKDYEGVVPGKLRESTSTPPFSTKTSI